MKTFRLFGHVTITWLIASLSIMGQSPVPESPSVDGMPPSLGPSLAPPADPMFNPTFSPTGSPSFPNLSPPLDSPVAPPSSLPEPVLPAIPTSTPTGLPVTLPSGAPSGVAGTPVSGPHFGPQLGLPGVGYPGVGLPSGAPLELPNVLPGTMPGPAVGPNCVGAPCPAPVCPIEEEIPIPIVKLKIKAPACAEVGKELEYRIKVENCTAVDAHNVVVRMALPASVKILRASPQVHQRDPDLQWNLGTIPGFGCHDIVVLVTPIGFADVKACTRVTFEHGQCVTTKVIMTAPDGSADGKGAGGPGGMFPGGQFPGGQGPGGQFPGGRSDFQVLIDGPKEAAVGQAQTYKITVFNKSDRAIYDVGAVIDWSPDLEEPNPHPDMIIDPFKKSRVWPKGFFEILPAGSSKTLTLILRARGEGRLCIGVKASGKVSQDPKDGRIIEANDDFCTIFRRGIPGMTLEMFDRDDPILKNAPTSYPIVITNQGSIPITNLRLVALVPDVFELDAARGSVSGPVKYTTGPAGEGRGTQIVFEPVGSIGVGQIEKFEVFVKSKDLAMNPVTKYLVTKFQVKFTADQIDDQVPVEKRVERWIYEEESTMIVADEETRKLVSRPSNRRSTPAIVTSGDRAPNSAK